MADKFDNLDYDEEGDEVAPQKELNKNQKIALGVFGFLGILVIAFWAVQLKNSISGPFNYENFQSEEENTYSGETCADGDCEQSEAELKAKDTDKDGLSDWNELNVYKTSPYLEDSDSDGFNDKEEIDSNKDPNCPAGKDCALFSDTLPKTASSTNENIFENYGSSESSGEQNLQNILSGAATADSLRKILLQSGITQEELDQISDEELMASYEETLSSQSAE